MRRGRECRAQEGWGFEDRPWRCTASFLSSLNRNQSFRLGLVPTLACLQPRQGGSE